MEGLGLDYCFDAVSFWKKREKSTLSAREGDGFSGASGGDEGGGSFGTAAEIAAKRQRMRRRTHFTSCGNSLVFTISSSCVVIKPPTTYKLKKDFYGCQHQEGGDVHRGEALRPPGRIHLRAERARPEKDRPQRRHITTAHSHVEHPRQMQHRSSVSVKMPKSAGSSSSNDNNIARGRGRGVIGTHGQRRRHTP